MPTFAPIAPAPVRDYRTFDFSSEITPAPLAPPGLGPRPALPAILAAIGEAMWSCYVAADSTVKDPDPGARLINGPIFDQTSTSQLVGDGVAGVTYVLTAQVTLTDGRIMVKNATQPCYGAVEQSLDTLLANGAVPFDYEGWVVRYPEFEMLAEAQVRAYWAEAGMLFRNDATSPAQDPVARREILEVLTAHIAALFAPMPIGRGGSAGGSAMMGVITSKSVNGVSVSASGMMPGITGTRAWFAQTQYGLKYLLLTAGWRQFQYVPGPVPRFPPGYWPAARYRW